MVSGDSAIAVPSTYILGAEESVLAIGFDANWRAGTTTIAFKVYDEISGTYKFLYDEGGNIITLSAAASKICRIKPTDFILLRKFQIIRDSSGTMKEHYGASTVITLYKMPIL